MRVLLPRKASTCTSHAFGIAIVTSAVQSPKALSPIKIIVEGSATDTRAVQQLNAPYSIVTHPVPIVTVVRARQWKKACLSI
jgi:hypothetical protein